VAHALRDHQPAALADVRLWRYALRQGTASQVVTVAQGRALKMPILAVVGGADPLKADVDAFTQLLPSLNVIVIDGATHLSTFVRPEFREAVHDFLTAHRTTTSQ
jgi:pimeloyl-ACP methyl ester carboxylesterase